MKNLSHEELDLLISKNLDIDLILDIIYAKGGLLKGLGLIEWKYDERKYKKIRHYSCGFFIYIIFLLTSSKIVCSLSEKFFQQFHQELTLIFSTFISIIFLPLISIPLNAENAIKRVEERGFKRIFIDRRCRKFLKLCQKLKTWNIF